MVNINGKDLFFAKEWLLLCGKLEIMLLETQSELQTLDELQADLEDQRELAQNRLTEVDKLSTNYKDCLQQVEKLKM